MLSGGSINIGIATAIAGVIAACLPIAGISGPSIEAVSVDELHHEAIVVDGHNDLLSSLIPPYDRFPWDNGWEGDFLPVLNMNRDLRSVTCYGHIDLPRLREGNLNVPYFAVFSSERFWGDRALEQALGQIYALHHNARINEDELTFARTTEDIREVTAAGGIAAVLTVEGADYITESNGKQLLSQFADLGVRVMSLTWNDSNQLAEGLHSTYPDRYPSEPDMGLTDFGADIVREMNELGIVVDVSHLHENSFWDVMEVADAPVIASHSSAAAIRDHPRNLTDRQLEALADSGGMVHITFVPSFLAAEPADASVEKVVDHIDHVVGLVGVEHVGLGSDFDGAPMPSDIPDASHMPRITEKLFERGYGEDEVRKILGENAMRVLSAAGSDRGRLCELPGVRVYPGFSVSTDAHSGGNLSASVQVGRGAAFSPRASRIIVDGEVIPHRIESEHYALCSEERGVTVRADAGEQLSRGFHVVTVEVGDGAGAVSRETRIIHVKE